MSVPANITEAIDRALHQFGVDLEDLMLDEFLLISTWVDLEDVERTIVWTIPSQGQRRSHTLGLIEMAREDLCE